ncbi:MATE family efflux transporter [Butyrivibrio sp. VCB2006]|uniref:MATE family efflux transporter n=1 Tax=Butyrivibrio sp. VCB2006 TaxID=1280679 RepID=UPI0004276F06|nr:MATE family efflux transporter [Butyrivibrio sp. VCB2006]
MNQNTNNYLAEERIGKLLLKFSIPCIMSLLVSSLYNIVDQIFIGRGVGYLGNGATNVVFPITVISLAIALMLGDGAAAYLSLCQGKKDVKSGNKSMGNVVMLLVASGVIMAVLFAVFKSQILTAFGATKNNLPYANEYFDYIILGIPFFVVGNGLNSIIRADGSPKFAMITTFAGCIINVILDPVAIFTLHMGMKGAAIATIAGQIVTAICGIVYILFRAKTFKLTLKNMIPDMAVIGKFVPLGISSFLTQLSIVVIMGVMNNVLVKYGAMSKYGADIPLTVVGIVMKVFQIVVSVCIGIAAGSQPIVGYNYGAGEYRRVKELFTTIIKAEAIVGLVSMLLFELFPLQITSIFGSEDGLYNEFAVLSFRIFLSMIILTCIQKSTSVFLQSLGKPVMAMGLSLLRDFVLSVPLAIVLPMFFGVEGALLSAPVADIVTTVAVVLMSINVVKELDSKINSDEDDAMEAQVA